MALLLGLAGAAASAAPPAYFDGVCEASAAVEVAPGTIAVADDDSYFLHLYRLSDHSSIGRQPLATFLGGSLEEPPDIEAAAGAGDTAFWITSHSLTKKANSKPERFKFFRTRLQGGAKATVIPEGKVYEGLRDDLIEAMKESEWLLEDAATRTPETGLTKLEMPGEEQKKGAKAAQAWPPSSDAAKLHAEGGLNIEGMASGPGNILLLGFRSPVRSGRALVLPLLNGPEITAEPTGTAPAPRARFGNPVGLDLGGLGIRSMERLPGTDDYLIVAGPVGDGGSFRLYRWHLGAGTALLLRDLPKGLVPEAILLPSTLPGQMLVLSDDGGLEGCKKRPRTRSAIISIPMGTSQNTPPD
jgi:hypothetical protein